MDCTAIAFKWRGCSLSCRCIFLCSCSVPKYPGKTTTTLANEVLKIHGWKCKENRMKNRWAFKLTSLTGFFLPLKLHDHDRYWLLQLCMAVSLMTNSIPLQASIINIHWTFYRTLVSQIKLALTPLGNIETVNLLIYLVMQWGCPLKIWVNRAVKSCTGCCSECSKEKNV